MNGKRFGILILLTMVTGLVGGMVTGCKDEVDNANDKNGSGPDGTGADSSAYADCVDRINGFRATLDLPPLERWTEQEDCSDDEAASDAATNTAHGAFGDCGEWAQNECPGWGSVEQVISGCIESMWNEGPGDDYSAHGHYINMTNTSYTKVACGFHETADGSVWSVQNFK